MDPSIRLVIVLFVLSIVWERINEFLKSALSSIQIPGVKSWALVGDTTTKYPEGSKEEQQRQYRILKVNLLVGILTAILCHADMIELFKHQDNPSEVLGWGDGMFDDSIQRIKESHWDTAIYSIASFLFGCVITGAFISMGSKFWHDLLDILIAVKNVKRSVVDELNKNEISVKNPLEQEALLTAAINENLDKWRNTIKNFQGVTIAHKLKGQNGFDTGLISLQFNVTQKEQLPAGIQGAVPKYIYYAGVRIPTDVKETGVIGAASAGFTGAGIAPKPGGSSICRSNHSSDTGTLGLRVRMNGKWYGFSCYHVLFPDENRAGTRVIEPSDESQIRNSRSVFSPSGQDGTQQDNIGDVAFGKLNRYIDVGFFETTTDDVDNKVYNLDTKLSIHDFDPSTEKNKLKVKFCGRTSGVVKQGVVTGTGSQDITYYKGLPGCFTHNMTGLLELKITADRGDSGALVLTEEGRLLGVITAVGNGVAYAVSMRSIINNYSFELN